MTIGKETIYFGGLKVARKELAPDTTITFESPLKLNPPIISTLHIGEDGNTVILTSDINEKRVTAVLRNGEIDGVEIPQTGLRLLGRLAGKKEFLYWEEGENKT